MRSSLWSARNFSKERDFEYGLYAVKSEVSCLFIKGSRTANKVAGASKMHVGRSAVSNGNFTFSSG
jgi:hypothetical protein